MIRWADVWQVQTRARDDPIVRRPPAVHATHELGQDHRPASDLSKQARSGSTLLVICESQTVPRSPHQPRPHLCERKRGAQLPKLVVDKVEVWHGSIQRKIALSLPGCLQQLRRDCVVVSDEALLMVEILWRVLQTRGPHLRQRTSRQLPSGVQSKASRSTTAAPACGAACRACR